MVQAGFSEKESAIYMYLLSVGGAYPSVIAQKTGLQRSTTYQILADLSIKGLINEVQKGSKLYYQIENPSKLVRFSKRRVDVANDTYEDIQALYPELEDTYALLSHKPRVLYFEGKEGVMSIYDDHIAEAKPYEMLGFASTADILGFLGATYFSRYRKEKVRRGITTRGILPHITASTHYAQKTYGDVPAKFRPSVRYLPQEKFPFKGEVTVYGEAKVSIMNLEKERVTGIIIEDRAFHLFMRSLFDIAWESAR